jgi:hypothetical protein
LLIVFLSLLLAVELLTAPMSKSELNGNEITTIKRSKDRRAPNTLTLADLLPQEHITTNNRWKRLLLGEIIPPALNK